MRQIGCAIQSHAEAQGYGVVRAFVGHGIAEQFHTDLQIPHYDDERAATVIEPGMTFTIEPMITIGAWQHEIWPDDWTAVTIDRKRTAQFEHTLLVTDDGAEVLRASTEPGCEVRQGGRIPGQWPLCGTVEIGRRCAQGVASAGGTLRATRQGIVNATAAGGACHRHVAGRRAQQPAGEAWWWRTVGVRHHRLSWGSRARSRLGGLGAEVVDAAPHHVEAGGPERLVGHVDAEAAGQLRCGLQARGRQHVVIGRAEPVGVVPPAGVQAEPEQQPERVGPVVEGRAVVVQRPPT